MRKQHSRLRRSSARRRSQILRVEALESRALLATFTVTNTADSGPGSLRQAILAADASATGGKIVFQIPTTDPGFVDVAPGAPAGVSDPHAFVIRPLSPLPPLNNPRGGITIDTRTQAAFTGNTNLDGPEIVLDGSIADSKPFSIDDSDSNPQFQGAIASNSSGNFVVVWSRLFSSTDTDIYARLFNSDGTPRGDAFRVNTYTLGIQNDPAVAMDPAGNFTVTWTSFNQNDFFNPPTGVGSIFHGAGVYGQHFNATGVPQGGEFMIQDQYGNPNVSIPIPDEENSAVATDSSGDLVYGWQSTQNEIDVGVNPDVGPFFAPSTVDWSKFVSAIPNQVTQVRQSQFSPSIAMAPNGNFVLTWVGGTLNGIDANIYAQMFNADGTSKGSPFQVDASSDTDEHLFPSVAMDGSGDFVVTWKNYLPGGNLYGTYDGTYAQRFNATGVPIGGAIRVDSTPSSDLVDLKSQSKTSVAMGADGSFSVAWDQEVSGVNLQQYNAFGEPLGRPILAPGPVPGVEGDPSVAIGANGATLLTWKVTPQNGGPAKNYGMIFQQGSPDGLVIFSDNNQVFGLDVQQFGNAGILIDGGQNNVIAGNYIGTDATGTVSRANVLGGLVLENGASNNVIGGTTPEERNIISGNASPIFDDQGHIITYQGDAILLLGSVSSAIPVGDVTSNIVQGNYIGTDRTGTVKLPNGDGVVQQGGRGTIIGGTEPGAGNLLSGNYGTGIDFSNGATGTLVQGNLIGTDATGTQALGNGIGGIYFQGPNNTVGGTTAAARNIISGNGGRFQGGAVVNDGIAFAGNDATGNIVQGNFIGTDITGTHPLGNLVDGIIITFGAHSNLVGGTVAGAGNLIAFNGFDGVAGPGTILGNSIHDNTLLGINNQFQDFPVLSSAITSNETTVITGSLSGTPNTTYRVEFFSNPTADPSGYGEGQTFLIFSNVTTDSTGLASFIIDTPNAVAGDQFISATATDPAGNTSEFSADIAVMGPTTAVFTVTTTADNGDDANPTPGSLRQAILAAGESASGGEIVFNIPTTDPGFVDVAPGAPGGAGDPHAFVIQPPDALPALSNPDGGITIDGTTQTAFTGDTNPFGPEVILDGGMPGAGADGLVIYSDNNQVFGLDIQQFSSAGILINKGQNNVIAGNYIGTDATGTVSRANFFGGLVLENGASNNIIGGTTPEARNIISGNASPIFDDQGHIITYQGDAILLLGSVSSAIPVGDVTGNIVQGNYIGTDRTGIVKLPNGDGVVQQGGQNTIIGGNEPGAGNLLSGNYGGGIDFSNGATGTLVQGNLIGTDATGTQALGNGIGGIYFQGPNNTVGGTTAAA